MYDNSQPPGYNPSPAPSGSGKGKIIAIVIVLLIFCCVVILAVSGIVFLLNRNNDNNSNSSNNNNNNSNATAVPTATLAPTEPPVADGYEVYTNNTYKFSYIIPEDWTVSPSGKEFHFKDESNEDKIQLLVQDAAEYSNGTIKINTAFCQDLSVKFAKELKENGATGDISVAYFTLNDIPGCGGRSEVISGVYQRYYFFFNEDTNSIYFMFYTTIDPTREEPKLKEILDSFEFTD